MSTRRMSKVRTIAVVADTNVVPIRNVETKETILAEVEARRKGQQATILALIRDARAELRVKHEEQVQELLPIGRAMHAQTLMDWIEIGRRMAGLGGRR